jgi:hypothetical protein
VSLARLHIPRILYRLAKKDKHLSLLSPQFVEIWRRREVVGISILFMLVDCLGGVFSMLSLVFKDKIDVIASVTYLAVVVSPPHSHWRTTINTPNRNPQVLDGLVLLLAAILNPRAKRRRAREADRNTDANAALTISPR